jgi:hypothetical protein
MDEEKNAFIEVYASKMEKHSSDPLQQETSSTPEKQPSKTAGDDDVIIKENILAMQETKPVEVKKNKEEKPTAISCKDCKQKFASKNSLKVHLKSDKHKKKNLNAVVARDATPMGTPEMKKKWGSGLQRIKTPRDNKIVIHLCSKCVYKNFNITVSDK